MSTKKTVDPTRAAQFADRLWETDFIKQIWRYIEIPNCTPEAPAFHDQEATHLATSHLAMWAQAQAQFLPGLTVAIRQNAGDEPIIVVDVPGTKPGTVLMYGHLDKQPPMTDGWHEGLSPYQPVIRGDRLYGRGAADDGYSIFAAIGSLRVLRDQGIPHAHCIILIEGAEETGSPGLDKYVEEMKDMLAGVDLVVCLDSNCGDYDRMWVTTSVRGLIAGNLRVQVLSEGVHSGQRSGIVPSVERIMRMLLARVENTNTGEILIPELYVSTPTIRLEQAREVGSILGKSVYNSLPWYRNAGPVCDDPVELILNHTWRPTMTVVGAEGLPPVGEAGPVLHPHLTYRLSFRVPPGVNVRVAAIHIKLSLEVNQPYGARVYFTLSEPEAGWNAPEMDDWLRRSVNRTSRAYWGNDPLYTGEGGTISFMKMLNDMLPDAQFLVTGVLGPESNAHGPNEFLHIPTVKRLTAAIASVIADHGAR